MGTKLAKLFQSESSKKIILVLGLLFLILTIFISLDPAPFLKFSYLGVFVFNLFGPGTLLIPSLSRYMNIFGLALATTSGMVLNDSISWLVGRSSDVVVARSKKLLKIEGTLHKFGPFALFFWSLIPIPYDLIGLVAGYLEFSYKSFIIPTFLGKFVRFLLLGYGTISVLGRMVG